VRLDQPLPHVRHDVHRAVAEEQRLRLSGPSFIDRADLGVGAGERERALDGVTRRAGSLA